MKVKVRYKQKRDSIGIYSLIRIIELKPNNKIFKNKIEKKVSSNFYNTNVEYIESVKRILNYSREELLRIVKPVVKEHLADIDSLDEEIKNFEVELDID